MLNLPFLFSQRFKVIFSVFCNHMKGNTFAKVTGAIGFIILVTYNFPVKINCGYFIFQLFLFSKKKENYFIL